MVALFSGKVLHSTTLIPGGVTEKVTPTNIAHYKEMLLKVRNFIESAYIPDVVAVAQVFPEYFSQGIGCGNFLSCGVFPERSGTQLFPSGVIIDGKLERLDPDKITEDTTYSMFSSRSGLHPSKGETIPDPDKSKAYSLLLYFTGSSRNALLIPLLLFLLMVFLWMFFLHLIVVFVRPIAIHLQGDKII